MLYFAVLCYILHYFASFCIILHEKNAPDKKSSAKVLLFSDKFLELPVRYRSYCKSYLLNVCVPFVLYPFHILRILNFYPIHILPVLKYCPFYILFLFAIFRYFHLFFTIFERFINNMSTIRLNGSPYIFPIFV